MNFVSQVASSVQGALHKNAINSASIRSPEPNKHIFPQNVREPTPENWDFEKLA